MQNRPVPIGQPVDRYEFSSAAADGRELAHFMKSRGLPRWKRAWARIAQAGRKGGFLVVRSTATARVRGFSGYFRPLEPSPDDYVKMEPVWLGGRARQCDVGEWVVTALVLPQYIFGCDDCPAPPIYAPIDLAVPDQRKIFSACGFVDCAPDERVPRPFKLKHEAGLLMRHDQRQVHRLATSLLCFDERCLGSDGAYIALDIGRFKTQEYQEYLKQFITDIAHKDIMGSDDCLLRR